MTSVRAVGIGLAFVLSIMLTLRICNDFSPHVIHPGDCPPCILPRSPSCDRGRGGKRAAVAHQETCLPCEPCPDEQECPEVKKETCLPCEPCPDAPECPEAKECPVAETQKACPVCPKAPSGDAGGAHSERAAGPSDTAPSGRMKCSVVDLGTGEVRCKAPSIRFAVVMPFVGFQANYVNSNIWSWSLDRFSPCTDPSISVVADLVFYVSRDTPEWKRTRKLIEEQLDDSPARGCFGDVHFRDAGVPASKDVYGAGTLAQFYGIFDREYLKLPAYDYILYMEPDTRPVRAGWLDAVYTEIVSHHPMWSMGSAPRYGASEVLHINGNAIYRYAGDEEWIKYLCESRGAFKEYASFDQSLEVHRKRRKMYNIAHKFAYSDVIQNRADQRNKLAKFLKENPDTYLVHGKGIVRSIKDAGIVNHKFKTDEKPPAHAVKDSLTDKGANACRKFKK